MDAGIHRPAGAPVAVDDGPPIAESTVDQAITWYVRLASGQQTARDQADFEHWLAGHAEHARAWRRLQGIGGHLQGTRLHIQPAVARSTLALAAKAMPPRRRAFKALAWVGIGGTALYLAQRQVPWRTELVAALADERTATGARRSLVLPDGTRLMLNTATAVDIRFDARQRRVLLRGGEILVATARDLEGRPFVVETQEGTLVPVGTRFTVRRDETELHGAELATRLGVSEGAVEVRPADDPTGAPVRVAAGQKVAFTRAGVGAVEALSDADPSWADGVLVAERTPLGQFVAELSRYRTGRLRCAPEVAGLRITGTWPLEGSDPTERILASLERHLPVRIHRLTRYWVTVQPR